MWTSYAQYVYTVGYFYKSVGLDYCQDGVGSVGEVSKRSLVATVSSFSRSDGELSQKLSTTEQGKEEDSSRKDKASRTLECWTLIHPLKLYHDSCALLSWQQYLKKLHMQERAVEEVKLAIKPFYQRRDINKDEYKEILRKAVQKVGLGLSRILEILLNITKYPDIFLLW